MVLATALLVPKGNGSSGQEYAGSGGIESTPLYAAQNGYAQSLLAPSAFDGAVLEAALTAQGAPAISMPGANAAGVASSTASSNTAVANATTTSSAAVSTSAEPVVSLVSQLTQAVRAIEGDGYAVGYALLDLNTGTSISYNADLNFYSASSIKGPYVTSLVRYKLGESAANEDERISSVIVYSDNDAYSSLRNAYGNDCFAQLVGASGAEGMGTVSASEAVASLDGALSGESISDNNYEYYSPNQLLALWGECYTFLTSSEPGASWLASYFEQPETSAIRPCASGLGTTWSKAGWYPADDGDVYGTTVDAGVVRTASGDFLLAVMTTKPEDFSALESVVTPLVALRNTLVTM